MKINTCFQFYNGSNDVLKVEKINFHIYKKFIKNNCFDVIYNSHTIKILNPLFKHLQIKQCTRAEN